MDSDHLLPFLVEAGLLGVWLQLNVSGFRSVLARGWHGAASSSRSQIVVRAARVVACLTWEAPSVGVRWRALLSVVIVTHLVTRSLASWCRERLFRRSSAGRQWPVTPGSYAAAPCGSPPARRSRSATIVIAAAAPPSAPAACSRVPRCRTAGATGAALPQRGCPRRRGPGSPQSTGPAPPGS